MESQTLAPGARVLIRNAEWRVKRIDQASYGGKSLTCIGLSELVKNHETIFLEDLENINIIDPMNTDFVQDDSPNYRKSRLYLESLLKQAPPTDSNIYIGQKAAMDLLDFQLKPTLKSLRQHRQRILIADAVGLGKTLEAGILVSELIKRGRGKRILCLTMKSMLTQFQKELWTRFAIPLVRLDSAGIQRIRKKIPANHNPFYYYDKTIISIDTLKQDSQYRTYIENCYWDIIIIDEAQNVAHRGNKKSLRARLADLLANKSDTMIMLSATPHDGKPESFASLMKMLNPISIADEHNYSKEDIKGQFIRRYKKDIEDQVQQKFKERDIHKVHINASETEEELYSELRKLNFPRFDENRSLGHLFKTTLEKSLLSSPASCLETIENKIEREKENDNSNREMEALSNFANKLKTISPEKFSKYQKLLELLQGENSCFSWDSQQPEDRVVIFTERIRTMKFLKNHLTDDLSIAEKAIIELHGSMSDMEQQDVVEKFGNKNTDYRLLIASDVASEGINLHYQCNKLIHFDIPWSLMVFQQRNGRIDRYGQERKPQIYYLVQETNNDKIKADNRILELLIDKDEYAQKNIGDSSVFMGQYDIYAEENTTAKAIEEELDQEEFEERYLKNERDIISQIMGSEHNNNSDEIEMATEYVSKMPSLFNDDFEYVSNALKNLSSQQTQQVEINENNGFIKWTFPEELKEFYDNLPEEIIPKNWYINFTDKKNKIKDEIERARENEDTWPRLDYLWELHPVVQWLIDKSLNAFGRREAPIIEIQHGIEPGEQVIVCSGTYPNQKGRPTFHKWCAVHFPEDQADFDVWDFNEMIHRLKLSETFPNRNVEIASSLIKQNLEPAIESTRAWLEEKKEEFENRQNEKLQKHLDELEQYREKQIKQLRLRFEKTYYLDKQEENYNKMMDDYMDYIEKELLLSDKPHIQVIAAFIRKNV